jgi:hypothetical protein
VRAIAKATGMGKETVRRYCHLYGIGTLKIVPALTDDELAAIIRELFDRYRCGQTQMAVKIREAGHPVTEKRVRKMMRELALHGDRTVWQHDQMLERKNEIERLYGLGWSQEQIADHVGTSQARIAKQMKRWGITPRPRGATRHIVHEERQCPVCERWFTPAVRWRDDRPGPTVSSSLGVYCTRKCALAVRVFAIKRRAQIRRAIPGDEPCKS